MNSEYRGLTDEAARSDLFEIQRYIEGLTTFIETCHTPMTISIQGSWGTGKTSIMQFIQDTLNSRNVNITHSIWFNTWQFSQFNMEDSLTVSLLSCLLNELAASEEDRASALKTTRALQFAGKITKEMLLSAVDSVVGSRAADTIDKFLNSLSEQHMDAAEVVRNLRSQFQTSVEHKLKATGKDRIVVFIDDLDRLEPRKAVELLEVLKLFLDCPNCVFVLAIDYSVVCLGVEAKYGSLLGDRTDTSEKGRSFFDKIIQVPFKVPVAEYNIENYALDCFQQIGMPCSKAEVGTYVSLIRLSIGANPRSMKRLFNSYLLLTLVVPREVLTSDVNKQILFGILCLQQSYEKIYNLIVERRQQLSFSMLNALATAETQNDLDAEFPNSKLNIRYVQGAQSFLDLLLNQVIDSDHSGEIDEAEMETFRNVLSMSTMTATIGTDPPQQIDSAEVATLHELQLDPAVEAQAQSLLDEIAQFGDDVNPRFMKNKSPAIQVKRGGVTTFMTIYFRKYGFFVDCYCRNSFLKDKKARDIVKSVCGKSTVQKAPLKIHRLANGSLDETSRQNCMIVAKSCYEKCPI